MCDSTVPKRIIGVTLAFIFLFVAIVPATDLGAQEGAAVAGPEASAAGAGSAAGSDAMAGFSEGTVALFLVGVAAAAGIIAIAGGGGGGGGGSAVITPSHH
ncbi:MAG TPA: hypothetical protein VGJ94_08610 [Syntrophorhabdaceae bacterium]|jgi:hypothetical protein